MRSVEVKVEGLKLSAGGPKNVKYSKWHLSSASKVKGKVLSDFLRELQRVYIL